MRWRILTPYAVLSALIVIVSWLISGAGADSEPSPVTVTTAVKPPAKVPADALRLTVARTPSGHPLPGGYLGFSLEFTTVEAYAGSDPDHLNPTFLQLVRNLNPGQSPRIRIGGDSTDWSWWPAAGVPKPRGVTYTITRNWLRVVRAIAVSLDARVMPGIQFEADSRQVAAAEAAAMLKTIGRKYISAFELGNEPEVYGALPWFHTAKGDPVPGRPRGYDLPRYIPDFASVSRALPTTVPIAGPASGGPGFFGGVPPYLSANPRVKVVTFHRYPLAKCITNPANPQYATMAHLLAPFASQGIANSIAAAVRAAHAHGDPLRVDELNSVSCRGVPGISDTFASALWVIDALFNFDRVGVDGVNVHTLVGSNYKPFTFTHDKRGWRAQVRPLYYGLAMFARAAPPGSRLLPVAGGSTSGRLQTWATRAPDGTVRVVLINEAGQRTVALAVPGAGADGSATVTRLTAPSLRAKSGVRIGGQTYGAGGALEGTGHVTTVRQVGGRYVVDIPSVSAAMLTIQ
jgi:hypothetical protein